MHNHEKSVGKNFFKFVSLAENIEIESILDIFFRSHKQAQNNYTHQTFGCERKMISKVIYFLQIYSSKKYV